MDLQAIPARLEFVHPAGARRWTLGNDGTAGMDKPKGPLGGGEIRDMSPI
jgi:hypothetical protein